MAYLQYDQHMPRLRDESDMTKLGIEIIINNNIKIMYSGNIAEKPINAVIHKKLLKSIASATYLISEDGYAQI